jgi:hypothetical protein
MFRICVVILTLSFGSSPGSGIYLPVDARDRKSLEGLSLTSIGEFGIMRKARPGISAHYHTGIDIKRPSQNYKDEPIFPVANGVVISIRNDGPYAQIIVEHETVHQKFWTVYEHIAGIVVTLNERVTPRSPMARFMNKSELDKHGWQFDHFHFEVLKVSPTKLKRESLHPQRFFSSFTLTCKTKAELDTYFYHPVAFLRDHFRLARQ